VRTFVRMLRNPESDDIEGIIYSLNITNDKYRGRAFEIITDQEYDYEALLDPKNRYDPLSEPEQQASAQVS
jgi:hypothetical protein